MVLLDAGYGHDSKLRAGITALGKAYAVGIQPQILVWAPGKRPGRAPKKGRRDAPDTVSVKELALGLRAKAWHTIEWREGKKKRVRPRFWRGRGSVCSGPQRGRE